MIQEIANFVYKYLLFFLPSGGGHPWDYLAHFIVSFVTVLGLFFALKTFGVNHSVALITAVSALLAIALIKEIDDFRLGNSYIVMDMLMNFLGISAAVVFILVIVKLQN